MKDSENDNGNETARRVPIEALVRCKAVEEMPIQLEIEGEMMRFICFPEKNGTWNCGYVSEDLQTTFVNEENFHQYKTLEKAASACKKALQEKGYWPYT